MTDHVSLRSGVSLAELTTIGVGGPADRLLEVDSAASLIETVKSADSRGEPVLLLGGGSNVVISDRGFSGLVVLIRGGGITRDGVHLTVSAGQSWDDLVSYAVTHQLAGIECLSGIPGLVGATPIQNVGAYGQEVSDVIEQVTAYDRSAGQVRQLTPAECLFDYRTSRFKTEPGRWVVTSVELRLRASALSTSLRYGELSRSLELDPRDPTASAPLQAARDAVLALRRRKGMVLDPADPDTASCGSFFTNPVLDADAFARLESRAGVEVPVFQEPDGRFKVPAAWLIDQAGFAKGFGGGLGSGLARLSTKHPLAVTNRGGALAADVIALARKVRDGVREALGVTLVNEPVLIGVEL